VLVRVGAVDVPITTEAIEGAVDACATLQQKELHVLGWDWETSRCDALVEMARKKEVKLLLLQIPREAMEQQAIEKGDVRFFPLSYLDAEIMQSGNLTVRVALKDFVILNPELISDALRSEWSDYIDYWAVDWDSKNSTFVQGWSAYHTRRERRLPLLSALHSYETPGRRRVLVRAIDIFGNETNQAIDLDIQQP
jgi:adenine-specific DNA-methyltransferase